VSLSGFSAPPVPAERSFVGRWCRLVPLSTDAHAAELFAAFSLDREGRNWTYLSYGPFSDEDGFRAWLSTLEGKTDPLFFTVNDDQAQRAAGMLSLMRIDRASGCLEIGHVHFSPLMQGSRASTEAILLLARHAFEDLGYRRLEWKCDALNERSRRAALRLGFTFEGLFRQHMVYKNRNRDTAWYSMLDAEWPQNREAMLGWLEPDNFDEHGQQRRSLQALREARAATT
jgi:RimJ/RimL family protein N-acetyltransferase